jgi:hypothetical protein
LCATLARIVVLMLEARQGAAEPSSSTPAAPGGEREVPAKVVRVKSHGG